MRSIASEVAAGAAASVPAAVSRRSGRTPAPGHRSARRTPVMAEQSPGYQAGRSAHQCPVVVGEERPDYQSGASSSAPAASASAAPTPPAEPYDAAVGAAAAALETLAAALDVVQAVDWDTEAPDETMAAVVGLQRLANRLASAQVAALGAMDRGSLHRRDGSASLAAWYRNRTNSDPGPASRMCAAGRRLGSLPRLAAAFATGDVSLAHVTVVTRAAVPSRAAAFTAADEALTALACSAAPADVARAVRFLADQLDPDGSDRKPRQGDWTGKDPRRHCDIADTIDGLVDGRLLLDQLDGELLHTLLDAFDEPDPAGTAEDQRRSPTQRRADAFARILAAAAASREAPRLQGAKPHILGMIDLAKWLGRPEHTTFKDQLRYSGEIDLQQAARLLDDAAFTVVLTWGPWRTVNVGRRMRTAPAWMRSVAQMLWRRCPGPDCDRPAAWGQAHHETPWVDGGDTDLNLTQLLCPFHHKLLTTGGWTLRADRKRRVCIWTSPDGRVFKTRPP